MHVLLLLLICPKISRIPYISRQRKYLNKMNQFKKNVLYTTTERPISVKGWR
uniref:Uncharacterized protein n=1 Tax=Setaria viridis TaxID=4556 RepID=A0A4U6U3I3_SETVI|nr:hypothetical protein SEVIR_6G140666v2 [Setaria viridis]